MNAAQRKQQGAEQIKLRVLFELIIRSQHDLINEASLAVCAEHARGSNPKPLWSTPVVEANQRILLRPALSLPFWQSSERSKQ
jgi:hypothetical protein